MRDTATRQPRALSAEKRLKSLGRGDLVRRYGALAVLLLLVLFNILFTSNFFTSLNLWNLVIHSCPVIMVALAMTLVVGSGGIDISVGALMAVGGMAGGLCLGYGIGAAILIAGISAAVVGLFSGTVIHLFRLQPIVVTLTVSIAGKGFAYMLNHGDMLFISGSSLNKIAVDRVAGIPYQFFYSAALFLLFLFLTKKTIFGRYVEAMGDNPSAARLVGIKTGAITLVVYGLSGLLSGLAGILMVARTTSCDPNGIGDFMELNAIAAVAIGGTSLTGGKPNIMGTLLGALMMQVILMTVVMNNLRSEYAMVVKAAIIVAAVLFQSGGKRK